ncbi:hypothetical protein NPIL_291281, partial [Nephila pilipes]
LRIAGISWVFLGCSTYFQDSGLATQLEATQEGIDSLSHKKDMDMFGGREGINVFKKN